MCAECERTPVTVCVRETGDYLLEEREERQKDREMKQRSVEEQAHRAEELESRKMKTGGEALASEPQRSKGEERLTGEAVRQNILEQENG